MPAGVRSIVVNHLVACGGASLPVAETDKKTQTPQVAECRAFAPKHLPPPLKVMADPSPVPNPSRNTDSVLNDIILTANTNPFSVWLGSQVVSVLDSGAEGPGFKSQPRRCRVTVLGKLFTPIVPLFTKQQNW